jgi:excisionase family DNA binding protein
MPAVLVTKYQSIEFYAAFLRRRKGSGRNMEAAQRFFNVSEAADFLGVSAASLRKWSDDGLVPVYRTPGGQRRFSAGDLEQFLDSMRQPSTAHVVPRYGRNANSLAG